MAEEGLGSAGVDPVREVIVWLEVHNALWQNLSEKYYDSVVKRLCNQLEKNYERYRKYRHPDDDTLFVYTCFLAAGVNWHTFEFHVDDTTADTNLFVLKVFHWTTPIRVR